MSVTASTASSSDEAHQTRRASRSLRTGTEARSSLDPEATRNGAVVSHPPSGDIIAAHRSAENRSVRFAAKERHLIETTPRPNGHRSTEACSLVDCVVADTRIPGAKAIERSGRRLESWEEAR